MSDQAAELRRLMAQRAERRRALFRSIAVTSGKGGVGKTNIALNLGLALAKSGRRVALLDADWGLANADVLLGITAERDLRDVLSGRCRLEEIVQEAPFGLKLLPGGSGVAELANMPRADREHLMEELARVGDLADIVLLDTAPGISDAVVDLAAGADQVLIVTTPEPTALTDAYASAKTILTRRNDAAVGLVVNMVRSQGHAEAIAKGFSEVTQRFLGVPVPLAGCICADPKVADAVRNQTPFLLSHPESLAASCIRALAAAIVSPVDVQSRRTMGLVGAAAA